MITMKFKKEVYLKLVANEVSAILLDNYKGYTKSYKAIIFREFP